MTFVPPLNSPPFAPRAIGGSIPTTIGIRGRMSLRLIKRPDATTDAASGRFSDVPFIPQRLTFSVRLNR
jgi:hypothetical protein